MQGFFRSVSLETQMHAPLDSNTSLDWMSHHCARQIDWLKLYSFICLPSFRYRKKTIWDKVTFSRKKWGIFDNHWFAENDSIAQICYCFLVYRYLRIFNYLHFGGIWTGCGIANPDTVNTHKNRNFIFLEMDQNSTINMSLYTVNIACWPTLVLP